jgi:hypothetical protein
VTSSIEIEVERELIAFAHRMAAKNINTAEAMALLNAGAAQSFGLTLKANGIKREMADTFRDELLKEVRQKFEDGYARDPGEGIIV